jgi:hypothetical protein
MLVRLRRRGAQHKLRLFDDDALLELRVPFMRQEKMMGAKKEMIDLQIAIGKETMEKSFCKA